ncbi:MAG: hypothetical protein ACI8UG_000234 [Gammaproteobacteria bacterium]|jgi:hypothetical protein
MLRNCKYLQTSGWTNRLLRHTLQSLLKPTILKFYYVAIQSASHDMQVCGGHGYIKEWGMEQIYRDVRIATMFEGTTGIQTLDLLGHKILLTRSKSLKAFSKDVLVFSKDKSMTSGNPHNVK